MNNITKKNIYSFNLVDKVDKNNYETIIILAYATSLEDKDKIQRTLNITIPEDITTIYKGSKGQCVYFFIGLIKYVLMSFPHSPGDILKMAGIIGKRLSKEDECTVKILFFIIDEPLISCIPSILQGVYKYEDLKTIKTCKINIDFSVDSKDMEGKAKIEKLFGQNKIKYEIRDLVNMPVNILNSTTYVEYIQKNIPTSVKVRIMNKEELTKEGLNLILAVNQGSLQEPKLVILDYNPEGATNQDQPICLVGKGVMFDTGGINLKKGDFRDMKTDMTGTAVIYGVIKALDLYGSKKRVIGVLPLVQNDIGPNATHPGDVIVSYSGKTVEISDTDAEGRLILADGINYCKNFNPSLIIDVATLTGQVGYIFGIGATAIMGNEGAKQTITDLIKSGSKQHEYIWELPLWPEFQKGTQSNIADYINYSPSSFSSTIMGGVFLSNFVPNDIPWCHLDIAGVSFNDNDTPNLCAGATGAIFNTLVDFLIN